ncbi:helix-turn-helix domain-containing protein [Paenibacillus sp. FSL R5-0475]|uniref:helix-turn-helix domain-containing protein n=1 Tax=Paenibacillus sp. FSL R5-0475 TaxID=2921643 RepID=UPI0030FAD9D7
MLNERIDDLMAELMTTEEASALWNLSQDHLKRLCSSGKVVARKKGKTWLILREQLNPSQKEAKNDVL